MQTIDAKIGVSILGAISAVANPAIASAAEAVDTTAPRVVGGLTFLLTLVGFIRFLVATGRPRIEQTNYTFVDVNEAGTSSVEELVGNYLSSRQYLPHEREMSRVVVFRGRTQPSVAVGAFLVFCAAGGLYALGLAAKVLLPGNSDWWYGLVLLSPLMWLYYWNTNQREEEFRFRVDPIPPEGKAILYVKGPRDEIEAMESALKLVRNRPAD
ncbi:hypothetical protein F1559_004469 [Cyanidiococcus yangmingshanensis]|uniref:Cofactor assembly of complex C subunit B n=1 Tax=Cyanidiococcus yangmingshanensis TaxID=2690220 RepID=A0A7J7ILF2_9RHOD|nr:hypothetical protein F1559_004469 [Cyanidiococcus yangmingshanensis]